MNTWNETATEDSINFINHQQEENAKKEILSLINGICEKQRIITAAMISIQEYRTRLRAVTFTPVLKSEILG